MEEILSQVKAYSEEITSFTATDADSLEQFRIRFLGVKGIVKAMMGEMKNVPVDQKKEFGQTMNGFKQLAEEKFTTEKERIDLMGGGSSEQIDFTLPGTPMPTGSRHPVTLMRNRIVEIFQRLSFTVAEGPEIEDDWHNFTALNLDENHPARDMQDTFYLSTDPAILLRTHTSNVQIREMEKQQLPIRIICPGRVYRNETISARSHCFFHQVEGLYIDENVSFADLKQTPLLLCKGDVW